MQPRILKVTRTWRRASRPVVTAGQANHDRVARSSMTMFKTRVQKTLRKPIPLNGLVIELTGCRICRLSR